MWLKFKYAMEPFRVFSILDAQKMFPGMNTMNLVRWQKKGYLTKIINGWYCFPEYRVTENISWLAANLIYPPSYISLESALSYYNLIPEAIYLTTSVSTRRTVHYDTPVGNFRYRTVKQAVYGFGQRLIESGTGMSSRKILIADPEKAILDFFYLNHQYTSEKDMVDLRLDQSTLKGTDMAKLYSYLDRFKNKALDDRIFRMNKVYATT